jgi:hypothetical protein
MRGTGIHRPKPVILCAKIRGFLAYGVQLLEQLLAFLAGKPLPDIERLCKRLLPLDAGFSQFSSDVTQLCKKLFPLDAGCSQLSSDVMQLREKLFPLLTDRD